MHETYTIDCYHCGLIAQCPMPDVEATATRHYENIHPTTPAVRDLNFRAYLSPLRCDTCNDELVLPYWKHRSIPPTTVGLSVDNDGLWLTCRMCHGFWKRQDINGWVRFRIAIARDQTKLLDRRPDIIEVMTRDARTRFGLLQRRWDAGVLLTALRELDEPGHDEP